MSQESNVPLKLLIALRDANGMAFEDEYHSGLSDAALNFLWTDFFQLVRFRRDDVEGLPEPTARARSLIPSPKTDGKTSSSDGSDDIFHISSGLATLEPNLNNDSDKMLMPADEEEPRYVACFLCSRLLPSDLKNTTTLDGKYVHMECYLDWKKGRKEPQP